MSCGKVVDCVRVRHEMAHNYGNGFVFMQAARYHNWAMSSTRNGHFVCCEECYENCFDTSVGSVGHLKEDFESKRVPDWPLL